MDLHEVLAKNFRIYSAIEKKNIQDIHNETNISRTTISNIKNGLSKGIEFETIEKISRCLKISSYMLFKEDEL